MNRLATRTSIPKRRLCGALDRRPSGGVLPGAERFAALEESLRVALAVMPPGQRRAFSVVHASRDRDSMASDFGVRTLSWSESSGWKRTLLGTPDVSSAIELGGSGADFAAVHLKRWNQSSQRGTSPAVYGAFVDGLLAGNDPLTGGAPQLVGVFRIGPGRVFGTVVGSHRFVHGAPVTAESIGAELDWRNELFERVSGSTRTRLPGARRHARS